MKQKQSIFRHTMIVVWSAAVLAWPGIAVAQGNSANDMGDMKDMPGMEMPHASKKPARPKSRKSRRQNAPPDKASQKGAPMDNMPGMEHGTMPGMDMNHENMPGMDHGAMSAPAPSQAEDRSMPVHPMPQDSMPGMQHGDMQAPAGTQQPAAGAMPAIPGMKRGAMPGMEMGGMSGMSMGPMQGGSPPPNARDPNAYSDGLKRTPLQGTAMEDDMRFGRLLVNELEAAHRADRNSQSLDAEAWYGGDYNKAWFNAEGERRDGRLETLRTEALWDRVFATFWSSQLGVRHDTGSGPSRNWLAAGVRGLAPYWFETSATAYWGQGGMLAARAEVRYELLLTQRLVLQPKLEANLYSKDDPARGIGSGLSDLGFGLRLRYEIRRQFAPYIGVKWTNRYGGTADFSRKAGEKTRQTEWVAGLRLWF